MEHLTEYNIINNGEFITIETKSLLLVTKLTSYLDLFKGEQTKDGYLVIYHSSSQELFDNLIEDLKVELGKTKEELGDVLIDYKPRSIFGYVKDIVKDKATNLFNRLKGEEESAEDILRRIEKEQKQPQQSYTKRTVDKPVQEPLTGITERTQRTTTEEPLTGRTERTKITTSKEPLTGSSMFTKENINKSKNDSNSANDKVPTANESNSETDEGPTARDALKRFKSLDK